MGGSGVLDPRVAFGVYPQREDERPGWLERTVGSLAGAAGARLRNRVSRLGAIVPIVHSHAREFQGKHDEDLLAIANQLRYELKRHGLGEALTARCFALISEAASRTLGLRHFDVQLLGGWAMLNGMVAEMETGEGKTLTATLPAATAALAGVPVHVITVNDYLASRDAELMRPVYKALGLDVGVVEEGMDPQARQAAYGSDVTYCTNKQVAFDHLRDRLSLRTQPGRLHLQLEGLYSDQAHRTSLILRGLCFAIVDEADSVLVDEAVTPLIIARQGDTRNKQQTYEQALQLAGRMNGGRDFSVSPREKTLQLTEKGRLRLDELTGSLGGLWQNSRYRDELTAQALRALHLFVKDRQYLVKDGKVKIIDEFTGRVMADRSWERGLHQMIEVKEGCEITGEQETIGRISYQRFFRRYMTLAGMTGTAKEVTGELRSVYRLSTVAIPPNRPVRRQRLPDTIVRTDAAKWRAVVRRTAAFHRLGRPVLVGTRSVEASEHLGELLRKAGLPHQVLNARQDKDEAEIIQQAGERGQITVATNMAGRGTDIRLGEGVSELGGLHVIATERHEAGRVDRQLFGRCGRQGDPGSFEAIVSLEDELVTRYGSRLLRRLAQGLVRPSRRWSRRLGYLAFSRAQKVAERQHGRMRRSLLKMEEYLSNVLAFSGHLE